MNEEEKVNRELFRAVYNNDTKKLNKCIAYYKKRNIHIDSVCDKKNNTAFIKALEKRTYECARLLVEAGADINQSECLIEYAYTNRLNPRLRTTEWLLDNGANYNYVSPFYDWTILMAAIINNDVKLVERILQYPDVNVNNVDHEGDTALHMCIYHCCSDDINDEFECLKLLLDYDSCDKSIKNADGHTAESLARSKGYEHIANYIRDHEISIEAFN